MSLAEHIAGWSKDQSTQVGAVIINQNREVVSTGYNGPPRGVKDDDPNRHERPQKYFYFEHAERNAIFSAREPLNGKTLVCTMFPCADCARAIIQTGITEIITKEPEVERWSASSDAAKEMLDESGVTITLLSND